MCERTKWIVQFSTYASRALVEIIEIHQWQRAQTETFLQTSNSWWKEFSKTGANKWRLCLVFKMFRIWCRMGYNSLVITLLMKKELRTKKWGREITKLCSLFTDVWMLTIWEGRWCRICQGVCDTLKKTYGGAHQIKKVRLQTLKDNMSFFKVKKIHFNFLRVFRRKNDRKWDKNARIRIGEAARCAPAHDAAFSTT